MIILQDGDIGSGVYGKNRFWFIQEEAT